MAAPAPPTTELGVASNNVAHGLPGWRSLIQVDQTEHVPELQWPTSVNTYDRLRTDAQIKGLLAGIFLPIRRRRWVIDPNGARPEVVAQLAEDLGLPVRGQDPQPRGRTRDRFSFGQHLRIALLALVFGHYFFEQVGRIDEQRHWRLRKLAGRPPRTVTEIHVADDGGLLSIRQLVSRAQVSDWRGTEIPVSRLVAYVWDQEPGSWIGRSVLRECFKHWLVKDRLIRVDAMKHQRNGMGVPTAEAHPGATPAEIKALDQMMQAWKAGEHAGGAHPSGSKIRLVGTEGSVPDTIASIRYHDQQMARSLLQMFAELGQTPNGSRALGETHLDFFSLGLDATADWFVDTFNPHVVEDYVDWNWGESEQAPLVVHERDQDPELDVADLVRLIDAGAIVVDEELEQELRDRYRLPDRGTPRPAPPVTPADPAVETRAKRRTRQVRTATDGTVSLPDRPLRRDPFEHEITAAVDFAEVDTQFVDVRDQLVAAIVELQAGQIDELHDQIVNAGGDLAALTALAATPVAASVIERELRRMFAEAAAEHVAEAARQGRTIHVPDIDEAEDRLVARAGAVDGLLARALGEAASRRAVALSGGALTPTEVADQVAEHLRGLSTAFLDEQIAGAVSDAQLTGRKAAMRTGEATQVYASELLDQNTCESCADIDGTEYPDVDEAERDYPTGGFVGCEGGNRCRGTLVAVYDEADPTLEEPAA